jgi:hypothetical protein
METYQQDFSVREDEVIRCFEAILYDAVVVEKSAASKVSEYLISLTTQDSFNTYKNYSFSLNEMEATFSTKDDSLLEIVLRDTSVHKKLILKDENSTLVYAKGQDVVGKNSEMNDMTSKENIYSLDINGKEFVTPLNLEDVYEHLTGINLTEAREDSEEDIQNHDSPINQWFAFLT